MYFWVFFHSFFVLRLERIGFGRKTCQKSSPKPLLDVRFLRVKFEFVLGRGD